MVFADRLTFDVNDFSALGSAVDLAEELVGEHYRLTEDFWRRPGRYELKTLADLADGEITDGALAQVIKYIGPGRPAHRPRQFFRICLQDHRIRAAWVAVGLDPTALLTYVVTHELIHVVRFGRHDQLFEAAEAARFEEERRVHELTCRLLAPLDINGADEVFNYADPRPGAAVDKIDRVWYSPADRDA